MFIFISNLKKFFVSRSTKQIYFIGWKVKISEQVKRRKRSEKRRRNRQQTTPIDFIVILIRCWESAVHRHWLGSPLSDVNIDFMHSQNEIMHLYYIFFFVSFFFPRYKPIFVILYFSNIILFVLFHFYSIFFQNIVRSLSGFFCFLFHSCFFDVQFAFLFSVYIFRLNGSRIKKQNRLNRSRAQEFFFLLFSLDENNVN